MRYQIVTILCAVICLLKYLCRGYLILFFSFYLHLVYPLSPPFSPFAFALSPSPVSLYSISLLSLPLLLFSLFLSLLISLPFPFRPLSPLSYLHSVSLTTPLILPPSLYPLISLRPVSKLSKRKPASRTSKTSQTMTQTKKMQVSTYSHQHVQPSARTVSSMYCQQHVLPAACTARTYSVVQYSMILYQCVLSIAASRFVGYRVEISVIIGCRR